MDATEKDPSIVTDSPKIPGYTILSRLGEGGMATVYLAIQESFGRKVALKVMMPKAQEDKTYGERFTREAKIVARLSHPNIVPVYDVGVAGDYHYISMEHLNGGDLAAKIKQGLQVPDIIKIIKDTALALDYAHRKGIIHRDVKPDNIMFREDGAAVLTDFGIARPLSPDSNMTQVGKVIGTPKYMSPEQTKGEEIDNTCDIYALGIMFHEMLTGEVPYTGKDPFEIGIKHLKDPIPILPNSVSIFQQLLEGLMAKNKFKRIQSGHEAIEMIEAIQHNLGKKPGKKTVKPKNKPANPNDKTVVRNVTNTMRADINDRSDMTYAEPQSGGSSIGIIILVLVILLGGGFSAVWFAPNFAQNTLLMTAHTALMSLISPQAEPVVVVKPKPTPPPAPVVDPIQAQIKKSLEEAHIAATLGNYVTPFGKSALDYYRAVLTLAPENTQAKLGIADIGTKLVAQANEAILASDFDRARELISQAKTISENIPGLITAEAALKEHEQSLANAHQQSELDAAAAAAAAANAAAKREANAAAKRQAAATAAKKATEEKRLAEEKAKRAAEEKQRLARIKAMEEEERLRQEELSLQQAREDKAKAFQTRLKIKGLLNEGDTHFARMEYHTPPQNNALDKYWQALAFDQKNIHAREGIEKVIAIIIPEIQDLLVSLQEDKAKNLYDKAKITSPDNVDLKALGQSKGW